MNLHRRKSYPYADEIPQMEICDTEAVTPGQQKSDSITTHMTAKVPINVVGMKCSYFQTK